MARIGRGIPNRPVVARNPQDPNVTANAGNASATATAYNPTVVVAVAASPGAGSTTATAYNPTGANPYVFHEDWSGADGSAWNTARWSKYGTMSTQQFGGLGLIATGTTLNSSTMFAPPGALDTGDIAGEVMLRMQNLTNGGFYYFIHVRGNTAAATSTPYALQDAYEFRIFYYAANASLGVNLYEVDSAGSKTYRDGDDHLPSGFAAGDFIHFKWEVAGNPTSVLRYKVWKDGTSEPGSWNHDWATSTVANNQGAWIALIVQNGDTVNESLAFDNLAITAYSGGTVAAPGAGSVTATAYQPGASHANTAGAASATGTAYQPGTSHATTIGAAAATATAYDPTVARAIAASAGAGSVTATAYNPTVTTGGSSVTANAGLASTTATAYNPGSSHANTAGAASATATAYDPTVNTATSAYMLETWTQADGTLSISGWTSAGTQSAEVRSNKLTTVAAASASAGQTVYKAHGLNVGGTTDWRIDMRVDTALDSTRGGYTILMLDASNNGYGIFVGNALHIQRYVAGVKTNLTNVGRPGDGGGGHLASLVTLIHQADGDMEALLDGVSWGTVTDTTNSGSFAYCVISNYSAESPTFESTNDDFLISEGLVPAITYPPSSSSTANAGAASATATAYNPGASHANTAGAASATATAYNPSVGIGVPAGAASVTVTGYQPGTSHATTAGAASATATAYNPTVSTSGSANPTAGNAAVTVTAYDPTVVRAVAASAGADTATGTAYNPTVVRAINPSAGAASVTASAYNPTVVTSGGAVSVTPGTAQVTVTAFNRVTRTAFFEITAVTQTVTLTEREARRQGLRGSRFRVGSTRVPPSIMKHGPTYTVVRAPTPEQIAAADIFYQGGHIYEVTETEASALTAAGYGSMLTYNG